MWGLSFESKAIDVNPHPFQTVGELIGESTISVFHVVSAFARVMVIPANRNGSRIVKQKIFIKLDCVDRLMFFREILFLKEFCMLYIF